MSAADLAVVGLYLAGVIAVGLGFARRGRDAERFMGAGRSLPGWAVGLSIFGSYVSSISFLGNPGKAYSSDWTFFVFSLSVIPAAWVAVRWFIPFYRKSGEVSAYHHLEHRFGPWARTYAVVCYLLTQMARMGAVVYLLARAFEPLSGWSIPAVIVAVGAVMTVYTLFGGMEAVIWTGVVQSIVLVIGAAACVVAAVLAVPGGVSEIAREGNLSLGGPGAFAVILLYGLVINLQNFGIDQSYVQRYITARSDDEAAKSVRGMPWIYLPVAAAFFLIGTALFVKWRGQAPVSGDQVFPHFIANSLPAGVRGLAIAAILAAAMDSSLNSMATLTLCDLYKRYFRPNAGEREAIGVLRVSMVAWGALGTGVALLMDRRKNALDTWWELAGLFGGGMLGLFLLGLLSKRARSADALFAVICGVAVIVGLTFSPKRLVHPLLPIVLGTVVILLAGIGVSRLRRTPA